MHALYKLFDYRKNKHRLLNRIHYFGILLSIPEKGLHHGSHSPGATNTPKCENPFGFGEFLPDLAYVGEIANIRVHVGYRIDEMEGVVYS